MPKSKVSKGLGQPTTIQLDSSDRKKKSKVKSLKSSGSASVAGGGSSKSKENKNYRKPHSLDPTR